MKTCLGLTVSGACGFARRCGFVKVGVGVDENVFGASSEWSV